MMNVFTVLDAFFDFANRNKFKIDSIYMGKKVFKRYLELLQKEKDISFDTLFMYNDKKIFCIRNEDFLHPELIKINYTNFPSIRCFV